MLGVAILGLKVGDKVFGREWDEGLGVSSVFAWTAQDQ